MTGLRRYVMMEGTGKAGAGHGEAAVPHALGDLVLEVERNIEGQQWRFRLVVPEEHWRRLIGAKQTGGHEIETNREAYASARAFWDRLAERFADDMENQINVLFHPMRQVSRKWTDYASLEHELELFQSPSR